MKASRGGAETAVAEVLKVFQPRQNLTTGLSAELLQVNRPLLMREALCL